MDENWQKAKEKVSEFFAVNCEYSDFEIGNCFKAAIGEDMKHVLFALSRYKFVSKLMAYQKNIRILELGCGEAWKSILVQQNTDVCEYVAIDFDEEAIEWNKKYLSDKFRFIFGDIFEIKKVKNNYFNLVFSMDVIEHIAKDREDEFFQILVNNMRDDGVAVVGTPNENMAPYASEDSKASHINLYSQKRLYDLADKYFKTVFIFNMNDEIVNTGFSPMSCYIFAVCCGKK